MTDYLLQDAPELTRAIFMGLPDDVRSALRKVDVNSQDFLKRTALHAAAFCGESEIADLLLQENARVNVKDAKWYTPLHRACASKAASVVKVLLDRGADRNARDKSWQTPLHITAMYGSVECARLLLDGAASVNASDRGGHTPLHHAVYGGHIQLVRLLLSNGSSVNAFDKNDRRAMHWATSKGIIDLIDLLCEFGAEINCRDRSLYTPLHVAAALGHAAVARLLIDRGAELNALTAKGNSPLHIACLNGQTEVISVLLDAVVDQAAKSTDMLEDSSSPGLLGAASSPLGRHRNLQPKGSSLSSWSATAAVSGFSSPGAALLAAISAQNSTGYTPLHLAAASTDGDVCLEQLLIASQSVTADCDDLVGGLDLEIVGGDSERTPLHLAAANGRFSRSRLLIARGANVHACDRWDNTPLHLAAARGHELVVNTLLEAGARWNAAGDMRATPVHVASAAGFPSCLSRLMNAAACRYEMAKKKKNSENSLNSGECQSLPVASSNEKGVVEHEATEFPEKFRCLRALKDARGRSLVHAAALGGSLDCLRLVLFAGADPFEVDNDGRSPLHLAIVSRTVELQMQGDFLTSPAVAAGANSTASSAVALILLKLGVDPNGGDKFGCTPLHLAAAYDTEGTLVKYLLAHGANKFSVATWPTNIGGTLLQSDTSSEVAEFPGDETGAGSCRSVGGTLKSKRLPDLSSFDIILKSSSAAREPIFATPLYYPLHLASATGNTVGLCCLFEGISVEEAYRLVLESASMSLLQKEDDAFLLSQNNSTVSCVKPDFEGSHFFLSPLFLAAFRGQTTAVEFLLKACSTHAGVDCIQPPSAGPLRCLTIANPCGLIMDPLGRTPLHYAAYAGHLDTCRQLVNNPLSRADPAARDSVYQWNAVHYAAAQGHVPVVNFLLRWPSTQHPIKEMSLLSKDPLVLGGISLADVGDEHGRTPLMLAAQNRHPGVVELLTFTPTALVVSSPPIVGHSGSPSTQSRQSSVLMERIDAADIYGRTALHRAAANGHAECMKLLLESGADWSKADFRGRQALHLAATGAQLVSIDLLLQTILQSKPPTGADDTPSTDPDEDAICPTDLRGFTPLHLAAYSGSAECVDRLVRHSAYRHLKGNSFTAVHCAAVRGHVVCLERLLTTFGIGCLRVQDFSGRTPLHVAAVSDQLICLERIMDFAISSCIDSTFMETRQRLPVIEETSEQRRILTELVTAIDSNGRCPLMLAAGASALNTCKRLVEVYEESADTSVSGSLAIALTRHVDADGLTVLHHAAMAMDECIGLFIVDKLEDCSCFNKSDRSKQTPLHLAVASGHVKLVEILLARGADAFALDKRGYLPICAGALNDRVASCIFTMLLTMMPSISSRIPRFADFRFPHQLAVATTTSSDSRKVSDSRRSKCGLTDSIHSSDSEFF